MPKRRDDLVRVNLECTITKTDPRQVLVVPRERGEGTMAPFWVFKNTLGRIAYVEDEARGEPALAKVKAGRPIAWLELAECVANQHGLGSED